jgi:hypothetical protein
MKIKKSRLLQIIREEVELHEKNTFELDEELMVKLADENKDGKISKSEFNDAVEQDQEEQGLAEIELSSEDQIIKKGDGVIEPNPQDKLEIKIR